MFPVELSSASTSCSRCLIRRSHCLIRRRRLTSYDRTKHHCVGPVPPPVFDPPLQGPQLAVRELPWVRLLQALKQLAARAPWLGLAPSAAANGSGHRRPRFFFSSPCDVGRTSPLCHAVRRLARNCSSVGGTTEDSASTMCWSAISTSCPCAWRISLNSRTGSNVAYNGFHVPAHCVRHSWIRHQSLIGRGGCVIPLHHP